jgi:hypothetical protein
MLGFLDGRERVGHAEVIEATTQQLELTLLLDGRLRMR